MNKKESLINILYVLRQRVLNSVLKKNERRSQYFLHLDTDDIIKLIDDLIKEIENKK